MCKVLCLNSLSVILIGVVMAANMGARHSRGNRTSNELRNLEDELWPAGSEEIDFMQGRKKIQAPFRVASTLRFYVKPSSAIAVE